MTTTPTTAMTSSFPRAVYVATTKTRSWFQSDAVWSTLAACAYALARFMAWPFSRRARYTVEYALPCMFAVVWCHTIYTYVAFWNDTLRHQTGDDFSRTAHEFCVPRAGVVLDHVACRNLMRWTEYKAYNNLILTMDESYEHVAAWLTVCAHGTSCYAHFWWLFQLVYSYVLLVGPVAACVMFGVAYKACRAMLQSTNDDGDRGGEETLRALAPTPSPPHYHNINDDDADAAAVSTTSCEYERSPSLNTMYRRSPLPPHMTIDIDAVAVAAASPSFSSPSSASSSASSASSACARATLTFAPLKLYSVPPSSSPLSSSSTSTHTQSLLRHAQNAHKQSRSARSLKKSSGSFAKYR
jgi:hypothetical protein